MCDCDAMLNRVILLEWILVFHFIYSEAVCLEQHCYNGDSTACGISLSIDVITSVYFISSSI